MSFERRGEEKRARESVRVMRVSKEEKADSR